MRKLLIYVMFLVLTSFVFVPKQSDRIVSAKTDVAAVNSSLGCEITPRQISIGVEESHTITVTVRNIASYNVTTPTAVSSDATIAKVTLVGADFNAGNAIYTYNVEGKAVGNARIFFYVLVKDSQGVVLFEKNDSVEVNVTAQNP